ncbi:MAG: hypothetical protein ACREDW_10210 [Aestuariivirgaceae bacterium]
MSTDKENADQPGCVQTDGAAQVTPDVPIFRTSLPGSPQVAVRLLIGSLIAAVLIVIVMVSFGVLVPARVVSSLQNQINSLKTQNDDLRAELGLSQTKNKEYEAKLDGASPEQTRSQIYEMQATISSLEQQIEKIRAAEWPPLTASAQESLYQLLKDMPAHEVWIGYGDSGGLALAKSLSDVFKRLNWPQKYPILAVLDPQDGLWITPISDISEQLRDKIVQATGHQVNLFPRRERFPDKIGIVVGYRNAPPRDE